MGELGCSFEARHFYIIRVRTEKGQKIRKIAKMKWMISTLSVIFVLSTVHRVHASTAQVLYLGGITYLLPDECPDPEAFPTPSTYSLKLDEYVRCIDATPNLQTQCVTDLLQSGKKLTVPVYTDSCSAVCHGSRNHQDCPYKGVRLDGRGQTGDQDQVEKKIADSFLGR